MSAANRNTISCLILFFEKLHLGFDQLIRDVDCIESAIIFDGPLLDHVKHDKAELPQIETFAECNSIFNHFVTIFQRIVSTWS